MWRAVGVWKCYEVVVMLFMYTCVFCFLCACMVNCFTSEAKPGAQPSLEYARLPRQQARHCAHHDVLCEHHSSTVARLSAIHNGLQSTCLHTKSL